MKKILSLLVVLILASSFVLAQQGIHEPGTGLDDPELKEAGQGTGQGQAEPTLISNQGEGNQTQTQTQAGEETGEQIRERNREKLQTGLENALTQVTNENAREMLQRNLDRWMEKYQKRMEKMEGVEIEEVDEETGEATIKAQEPVKYFGFIKGKATKRFDMDKGGNINERAPWYSFLYSEDIEE
ncbi:hypothetical protein ACFLZB_02955 [Nanoarchaeota archaeon]